MKLINKLDETVEKSLYSGQATRSNEMYLRPVPKFDENGKELKKSERYYVFRLLYFTGEDRNYPFIVRDEHTFIKKDFSGNIKEIKRICCPNTLWAKKKIQEKVVIYWSRAFYAREKHENQSFLDFIEKLKANPAGFRVSAAQSRSLRKYMKKEMIHNETGEIVDSKKLLSMIDDDKLMEFNELMGYYQIVSSELDMDDLEIIDKYHGLTRIEDQFREMKGTLETRPIWVNTPEHIQAHLVICFMALTMMRVIQHKIKKSLPDDTAKDLNWSYGIPGDRFQKALLDWQIDKLPGDYSRMLNAQNEDLLTILRAMGIKLQPMLYTRGDIRSLKSSASIF